MFLAAKVPPIEALLVAKAPLTKPPPALAAIPEGIKAIAIVVELLAKES